MITKKLLLTWEVAEVNSAALQLGVVFTVVFNGGASWVCLAGSTSDRGQGDVDWCHVLHEEGLRHGLHRRGGAQLGGVVTRVGWRRWRR